MKSYNKKISCLLGLVGFALALALDQVTKYLAVMNLRENGPVILIKNVFQLQYLETGSSFRDHAEPAVLFCGDRCCDPGDHRISVFKNAVYITLSYAANLCGVDRIRCSGKYD